MSSTNPSCLSFLCLFHCIIFALFMCHIFLSFASRNFDYMLRTVYFTVLTVWISLLLLEVQFEPFKMFLNLIPAFPLFALNEIKYALTTEDHLLCSLYWMFCRIFADSPLRLVETWTMPISGWTQELFSSELSATLCPTTWISTLCTWFSRFSKESRSFLGKLTSLLFFFSFLSSLFLFKTLFWNF